MNLEAIPEELKKYPNWLVWKKVPKDKGGFSKVPFSPKTKKGLHNVAECDTFENAVKVFKAGGDRWGGIGFHFSNTPFVGIDVDHCIKSGVLDEGIRIITVAMFNSYTETSPSGTGLHIIGTAEDLEILANKAKYDHDNDIVFEMYNEKRFFTVTGDVFENYSVINDVSEYAVHFQKYMQELKEIEDRQKKQTKIEQCEQKNQTKIEQCKQENQTKTEQGEHLQTVDEILEAYRNSSRKCFTFKTLFEDGDTSNYNNDQSSADLALMNDLCFYANGDSELMKECFMQSALANTLNRKKGHAEDYLKQTIATAIKRWNGTGYTRNYKPPATAPSAEVKTLIFPVVNSKGVPLKKQPKNIQAVLDFMGLTVRYNLLSKEMEILKSDTGRNFSSDDETAITEINAFCERHGLNINTNQLTEIIKSIALKNGYNPVCGYLNSNYKDYRDVIDLEAGENIDALFSCLKINGTSADKALYKTLFTKWLIGAYKIAFNQGEVNCEGVLVLQGKQGIGKTRFLYALTPCDNWVKEGMQIRKGDRDEINAITKHWLVELGEIGATVKRSQLDFLKTFITSKDDEYRLPYARKSSRFPRLTAFLGTVNQSDYLKDDTGDRRYWTIPVEAIKGTEKININMVWAEVAYKVLIKREPHYLTAEEMNALNKSNTRFQNRTSEEIILLDRLGWDSDTDKWTWWLLSDLCIMLDIPNNRIRLLGRAISRLMLEDNRIKKNTNHHSNATYLLPPVRGADEEI